MADLCWLVSGLNTGRKPVHDGQNEGFAVLVWFMMLSQNEDFGFVSYSVVEGNASQPVWKEG